MFPSKGSRKSNYQILPNLQRQANMSDPQTIAWHSKELKKKKASINEVV